MPTLVATMAARPLILALANPTPEILPQVAHAVRDDVVIATGRSDFPNQVNNVLCFPYIFRGALDVGATTITREMEKAAVHAIAALAEEEQNEVVAAAYGTYDISFGPEYLIPKPFDPRLIVRIAPAVAKAAMEGGVATRPLADLEAYEEQLQQFVYHSGAFMKPLFASAKRFVREGGRARIVFTEGEDEQQIFDTINSLGVRLTTAELLKNYFFNRENEQAFKECWEDVFEPTAEKREYWEQEVVTGRIKRTLVDLFFDAFLQILVQDKRRGVTTEDKLFYSRTSNLFQSYKDFIGRYCNGDKVEILDNMKAYAEVFESTFDPSCCDADIPSAPGVERLNVLIFGLKNSTLIPYVLYVRKNAESSGGESGVYALLESYIVRRMLVQATTKNYNRLFTSLILNEVKDAEALRKALETNDEATTYMPGDAEVRAAFDESCLYNLQSKGVLYLLESAIRPGMSSTALLGFNQYTLEHMMPKKWRNKWGALDDEAAAQRDRKLLTLGNLAIITHSLNASIRDADWSTKKQGKGYKDGLALCAAGLATMAGALEKESWDEDDIADRAEWLADKALEVWH